MIVLLYTTVNKIRILTSVFIKADCPVLRSLTGKDVMHSKEWQVKVSVKLNTLPHNKEISQTNSIFRKNNFAREGQSSNCSSTKQLSTAHLNTQACQLLPDPDDMSVLDHPSSTNKSSTDHNCKNCSHLLHLIQTHCTNTLLTPSLKDY